MQNIGNMGGMNMILEIKEGWEATEANSSRKSPISSSTVKPLGDFEDLYSHLWLRHHPVYRLFIVLVEPSIRKV